MSLEDMLRLRLGISDVRKRWGLEGGMLYIAAEVRSPLRVERYLIFISRTRNNIASPFIVHRTVGCNEHKGSGSKNTGRARS